VLAQAQKITASNIFEFSLRQIFAKASDELPRLKIKTNRLGSFFFACLETSKLFRICAVNVHFMLAEQSPNSKNGANVCLYADKM
jgi:hypothetical protein